MYVWGVSVCVSGVYAGFVSDVCVGCENGVCVGVCVSVVCVCRVCVYLMIGNQSFLHPGTPPRTLRDWGLLQGAGGWSTGSKAQNIPVKGERVCPTGSHQHRDT